MKKRNKIVASLLVSAMAVSMFAGCGQKEEPVVESNEVVESNQEASTPASEEASSEEVVEEPAVDISEHVVLTMYCIGDEGGIYAEEHLNKLNEVLTEKINAEIKPIMVSWGDYKTKLPMVWASGETYDLTYTSNWTGYFAQAEQGAYMDITELFPKYAPETYAELDGLNMLETTKVGDAMYMVPNNLPDYTTFTIVYREDLRKKYGCAEIVDDATFMAYLKAIQENEPSMTAFGASGGDVMLYQTFLNVMDWSRGVDGNSGVLCYNINEGKEIFNVVETPEYEQFVNTVRDFYNNGYWSKSIMAETTSGKDLLMTGKAASCVVNFSGANGINQELSASDNGWEIDIYAPDFAGSALTESIAASNNGMAIGTYSENPERAMMFIELCHQDEEVYHILMDGLEGTTFEMDKEKMVKWIPEETDPTTVNLKNLGMGFGTQKFYLGSLNDWDKVNELKEDYATKKVFPALDGFSIQQDPIAAELAAIKAVIDEYKAPLDKGTVDPAEGLATLRTKLKEAGIDKVIEEVNKQIAEFNAK